MSNAPGAGPISDVHGSTSDEDLLEQSVRALEHAYAPYSGLRVGCAIATHDNRIYRGANMENASYGVTVCAEVAALSALNTHEGLRGIERLALSCAHPGEKPGGIVPCGRCRQLIYEAANIAGYDVIVLTRARRGGIHRKPISALLPDGFNLR